MLKYTQELERALSAMKVNTKKIQEAELDVAAQSQKDHEMQVAEILNSNLKLKNSLHTALQQIEDLKVGSVLSCHH